MKDLKYNLLKKYLILSNKDYLVLTYKEINDIIQSELPQSAYKYRAFWGKGDTHVWVNAINNAGYEIASFSIESETVSF